MFKNAEPTEMLTSSEIRKIAPVSDMSLWRWIKAGKFPAPIKIGARNFWDADEINAWQAERSAARTA